MYVVTVIHLEKTLLNDLVITYIPVISAHAEQVVKRSIDVNNEIDLSSIGETAVFPTSHIPVFIFPQVTI